MNALLAFLDWLNGPFLWLIAQPKIMSLSILSLLVCTALILCGLALAKLRFSPLWVLAILVPYVPVGLLWILAYKQWPQEKLKQK